MFTKADNRSFTLVELLLYMGIVSILLVLLTQVFTSILDLELETEATSATEQDANFVMSRLAYDLRRAKSVSVPLNTGEVGNSLQLVIEGVNYTYSLNNGNLQLINNNGTDVLNSGNTKVDTLDFTKINNANPSGKDTVKINLTIESKTLKSSGAEIKSWSTTVSLR